MPFPYPSGGRVFQDKSHIGPHVGINFQRYWHVLRYICGPYVITTFNQTPIY